MSLTTQPHVAKLCPGARKKGSPAARGGSDLPADLSVSSGLSPQHLLFQAGMRSLCTEISACLCPRSPPVTLLSLLSSEASGGLSYKMGGGSSRQGDKKGQMRTNSTGGN